MTQEEEAFLFNTTRRFLSTAIKLNSINDSPFQEHLRTEYLSRLSYLTEKEARSSIDFCVYCGRSYKKLLRFRLKKDASHGTKAKTLKLVCSTCKHLNKFKLMNVAKAKRPKNFAKGKDNKKKKEDKNVLSPKVTEQKQKSDLKLLLEMANTSKINEGKSEPGENMIGAKMPDKMMSGRSNQFSFYYLSLSLIHI